MVVIEHLERRTLLTASPSADDAGGDAAAIELPVEGAATSQASVPTRVFVEFVRGNEDWDAMEVTLRAFVTALRGADGTYVPLASIGRVVFFMDGRSLGSTGASVREGQAQVRVEIPAGNYTFHAEYLGQADYLPSSSEPIEGDARRTRGLVVAGGVVHAGTKRAVTLTARITSAWSDRAPGGKVTFHDDGGNVVGVAKVVDWRGTVRVTLPAGKHRITARYSGDKRYQPAESRVQTVRVHEGRIVDLMVMYTSSAAGAMKSGDGLDREIRRAVDSVNFVMRKSKVRVAVRLVAAVRVSYDETGNYERDLKRLATDMDGHLDSVQTQRQQYGADLVSLFVGGKGKGDVVGTAYRMTRKRDEENERFAFSVVHAMSAAGPDYTLAHELAHNFGAAHDEENASPGRVVAPYAYGFKGFVDGEQVRDVMGYPPGRTLPFFSNPRITYGGVRLGDERAADVARLIGETAPIVAAYREEKVPWGEGLICPAC